MSRAEYWRDWEGRKEGVTEHSKREKEAGEETYRGRGGRGYQAP